MSKQDFHAATTGWKNDLRNTLLPILLEPKLCAGY